jgi:opacity protein-like surface antigen
MKASHLLSVTAAVLMATFAAPVVAQDEIEFKRVSITGQFDNGQVVKGYTHPNILESAKDQPLDMKFFSRTGVWVTQEAVVKERLNLIVGVGGIFWYSMPSQRSSPLTLQTQFGPGISQAQGIYTWGDLEDPTARLQVGYFPYKYNQDSKNLGEYLLRSGTYPGYLVTGGWNMVSSSAFMNQGARLNVPLWDGKFQSDFILSMETNLPPLFSLTPAYVATVNPVKGVTVGAGIACNHCLSTRPSEESPKLESNQIIRSATVVHDAPNGQYLITYDRDSTSHYTFQGVKVAANASIDPKAYIPMDFLGPEDLKLYGEIAVLGWKNYSYLYEKRSERMPIMVGFNIPTFKMLDVLSFELEYYNNSFVNNYRNVIYDAIPTWYRAEELTPTGMPGEYSLTEAEYEFNQSWAKRDNWKWSVYGKKEVVKGVRIFAQAASDHLRPYTFDLGAFPAYVPVTNKNGKEWYYIVRLEFGI